MRVRSPVGEYDYRVTAVRVKRDGIEIDGSLGQWQTTMVVEPKDLAPALRWLAVAGGLALAAIRLSR
ncbi:MAG TPA: hypothetical protein VH300_06910 [Thermoleophilaceae bacterium]|jgi:hypothetical protein|nr:hypothetical protein [Thermoleophilaceae bacterium]